MVQGQGFGRGPAFYPQVLAGVLIALGAVSFFKDFRKRKTASDAMEKRSEATPDVTYWPVIVFVALSVALIIAMRHVGFLLSGFLLAFFSVLLIRASFKPRQVALAVLYGAGMMALVYGVFQMLVGIQLPVSSIFN